MMNEIYNNITNIIILYAPTLLVYITQVIDWIVTLKKFKSLDVSTQVLPIVKQIKELKQEIKNLHNEINVFQLEKANLTDSIEYLKDTIIKQNMELAEIKIYLQSLSKENVALKAKVRSKTC